jgi:Fe-S oxidoreductase
VFYGAEKCNGSEIAENYPQQGTMCPSYRATRNEKDTTRARANALREYLTHSEKKNKFNHKELYEVSNCVLAAKPVQAMPVDVAALKSEFYTNTKKRTVFHCEIKSLLMPN